MSANGAMLDVVIDDDVSHDDDERGRKDEADEAGVEKRRVGERRFPHPLKMESCMKGNQE